MREANKWIGASLIAAGVLLFSCGVSFAQQEGGDKPPAPPSASEMVSRMKQDLGLNDEQVSQITPILEEEISRMSELMGSETDRESARSKMDALRQDTESKLAQYLTEDQMTKWKSRQGQPPRERPENMPSPEEGEGPGGQMKPPGDMMQE
jgi:hypothetical protein